MASWDERPLQVGVYVSGITAVLSQSLKQRESGTHVDSSRARSFGFGVGGEMRLPSVIAGLRPLIYGQVERMGAKTCVPDATCFFGEPRTVKAVGAGVAWPVG